MNPLTLLKLVSPKAWAALAIAVSVVALLGYVYKLGGDAPRAELAGLRASYKAAADRAESERRAVEAADKLRKEKADAKAAADRAAVQRTVDELRHQRDAARSAFLSRAPADSRCPVGQVCFDRAEYLGAYRALVAEVRGVADECTALAVDMNIAAQWARESRGD